MISSPKAHSSLTTTPSATRATTLVKASKQLAKKKERSDFYISGWSSGLQTLTPLFVRSSSIVTLGNIGSQAVLGNDGGVSQVVVNIRLLCVEFLLGCPIVKTRQRGYLISGYGRGFHKSAWGSPGVKNVQPGPCPLWRYMISEEKGRRWRYGVGWRGGEMG